MKYAKKLRKGDKVAHSQHLNCTEEDLQKKLKKERRIQKLNGLNTVEHKL